VVKRTPIPVVAIALREDTYATVGGVTGLIAVGINVGEERSSRAYITIISHLSTMRTALRFTT